MGAVAIPARSPAGLASPVGAKARTELPVQTSAAAPIVVAVGGSAANDVAVDDAVRLAADLTVPLVFVHVRRGPAAILGAPLYQRRLTAKMARARRILESALHAAASRGVDAESEVLEDSPRKRIGEFAIDRGARFVVGSRRRTLGCGVSGVVVRRAEWPVIVSGS
jgi:nucleotide-binding universal stress UspA family protein